MSSYNGWSNYETWVVKLWMDNESGSQDYWREEAAQYLDSECPRADLADALKGWHEENMPELHGVYADLMNAALGSVDWHEIATNLLSEAEG